MLTRASSQRPGARAALVLLALASFAFTWSEIPASTARADQPASHPAANAVTLGFDKTEPGRRVSLGIPVSRAANADGARPWIVYSVRLPPLDPGEHLRIRGEAGPSRRQKNGQRPGGGWAPGGPGSPPGTTPPPL